MKTLYEQVKVILDRAAEDTPKAKLEKQIALMALDELFAEALGHF